MKKLSYAGCLFMLFMLLIPGMASAKSLFEHQNTTVPAGQSVDDVYVVGGDADILGQVQGIVVVINGNLHLGSTARVTGVIVVIGGKVDQDPGAALGDDIYDISLDNATQNSFLIGGGLVLSLWVLQLAGNLLMVLVPVLIRVLGKKKIIAFTERYQHESLGRLLYAGFLSGLVIAALSALLLVTVIGIPILVLILLALLVALAMGMTVISYRIGDMIKGSERMPDWVKVLIGASMLTAFSSIPLIGWILLLVVGFVSLGICTQWIAGKRKKTKND
ncbi:hypothetical protein [Paenibacillus sacheonensis]|uniref:Uncharacterized protein n=1 Tax=Paenibacillus sacheonensis TaxID=742054 RepID=A0A7X5C1K9_9BACL|nr:hypothetical protein [Paenibacillus sacheonensis]MBM7569023.1 hypothetical protein [Paenibacillus sacheonensis]NBC72796.1 hypothetical protein [Paenibacillus sacheonensis]